MFDEQRPDEDSFQNLNDNIEPNSEEQVFQSIDDEIFSDTIKDSFKSNETDFSNNIVNDNKESDIPVTVQPVQFASFDEEENIHGKENKNLDLLMNVNLQMSVELGRTELPFKKVLELTRGSIISLDKLAGEPVELFANGKLVAFGEVVVIEDNFGLRITSIAAPEERLKTVHETTTEK